ncbi:MAG: hypothetical protein U9N35_08310 [Euryarchaeota archaeon]|nr:hypothetical protein [Euryarchaeota archaeon]
MNLSDKDKAIIALIIMIIITLLIAYSASFQILRLKTEKSNYIIITKGIDDSKEIENPLKKKDSMIFDLEEEVKKRDEENNELTFEIGEKEQRIKEKEKEIEAMEETSEILNEKNELYILSEKRLSVVLKRYSYFLRESMEKDQKDPRKFIKDSEELKEMITKVDNDDFLKGLYEYIIDNFYYFYDPLTVTSEGVQEWNLFLVYDLKKEEWIKLSLERDELLLSVLPETIFYPEETIELGGGDCEDLSILYASACIQEEHDAEVYVVDIVSEDPLIEPASHAIVVVDNTVADITMKQYITGENLFEQYGKAINAKKITLKKVYNDEKVEEKNIVLYST